MPDLTYFAKSDKETTDSHRRIGTQQRNNATTQQRNKPLYFPSLTGIRAVAAYMVFFFHVAQAATLGNDSAVNWLIVEARQWHIGVGVFFVLSGFLITTRYAHRIEPRWSWAKRYLQNRFARIYPIFFLLTVASFILFTKWPTSAFYAWPAYYTSIHKAGAIFFNLTLTRAFFYDIHLLGLPTAWSLTVEECFYISAPFILLSLRQGRLWKLALYPLLALFLGVGLVWLCGRLRLPYAPMKDLHFMFMFTYFGRCAEFVFGMALALWLQKQTGYQAKNTYYTVLGGVGILVFTAIIAMQQGLAPLLNPESWSYTQIFANNFVLPGLVCLLFYGLLTEQSAFRRLLETKLFDLLGKSSYIFYLIHLGIFDTLFVNYVSANSWVRLVAYTLASIALYKYIESPIHKKLRSK
ncbi:acyltransferase family protein [Hymenobacter lapidiphilus]|uniref:Acyltransferase n=1 Tax=Hymenobacter lapidiphilus TaxID=2608003 RepID=A0A7Y7PQD2_9BACT|nr:acyltransferase [Hymenobacter lapidiphilus]NVO32121.1 acyltransferase [Hymenobacter lapidiphilus]